MSIPVLDAAVSGAYPVVWHLATALAPVGGAAAAIVLCTAALRALLLPLTIAAVRGERRRAALAPQVKELQRRYAKQPDRLATALTSLYREAGTSPFAGFLPMLLQMPFFLVIYRLFRSGTVAGHGNALLHSHLFGVELSTRLLGAGQPLAFLVFVPFLALLAVLAWVAVRRARRLAGSDAPRGVLALLPFGTLVSAVLVPLAGVLYLVTTVAWTAGEQAVLRRR
jgi:YidC/Oxa1 family membrane protein insertase